MLKLKLQYFGHLLWRTDSFEKTLVLERLKLEGEGDYWGWDGWMALLTQWTWVWVNSGSWWWTGKPGVLQSMGSQRIRQNWATELNQQNRFKSLIYYLLALGPETRYFSVTLFLIENNNTKLIWPQQDFLHFLNRTNSWVSIFTLYVPWFIKTSSEIWTVSIKCFLQYFIFCWGLHILTVLIWVNYCVTR